MSFVILDNIWLRWIRYCFDQMNFVFVNGMNDASDTFCY